MKITKKVLIWGTSLGIVIDKPIAESLDLKQGDMVQIDIQKV